MSCPQAPTCTSALKVPNNADAKIHAVSFPIFFFTHEFITLFTFLDIVI